jgi:hypothetical protein
MVAAGGVVDTCLAMKLAALAMVAMVTASCSNKQPDKQPEPPPARNEPAPPAAAVAPFPPPPRADNAPAPSSDTLPADFPATCVEYAALIDKLKACDKLGAARDGLTLGYTSLRSSWSAVPPDQRNAIGVQCKVQAESLRNAAAATCGW